MWCLSSSSSSTVTYASLIVSLCIPDVNDFDMLPIRS